VGRRIVGEADDARVFVEDGLDDSTLNASAASVYEPDFMESRLRRRRDVFLDD